MFVTQFLNKSQSINHVLVYVNKKKLEKIKKKNKKHQENICIIFFTFLSLYFIRLQVVSAVVLIHPVSNIFHFL
jgi:uncharacterized membrane protein YjjP (DUF1212 family)